MKFTVKRTDLFRHLQKVQSVTERKSTLPILQHVLIQAKMGGNGGSSGHLDLTATDSEVTVTTSCPADVAEPGSSTTNGRRLFEIARLLPDEEVSVILKESGGLGIRCRKSRFQMEVGSPDEFPRIPKIPSADPIHFDFNTLKSMFRRVVFATAGEDTRYVYSGLLMALKGDNLEMAATDGHRLSVVRAKAEAWQAGKGKTAAEEVQVIIPKKALVNLERFEADEDPVLNFWNEDNHLFFQCGSWLMVTNTVEGNFAPYQKVVPTGSDKKFRVRTADMLEAVRRVSLMSGEKSSLMEVALRQGKLELSCREAGLGEAREEMDVEYDGKPVRIGFNYGYVADFISIVGSEAFQIDLKDPQAAGLFTPAEENPALDFLYVVMPMQFPGSGEEKR
ncbi:MAG: DNA polymerase III subunit beta [Acidobacteria bacterium]|nr:DNA polymerase III subunit beta [Acidobacteriota bacterium]